MEKKQETDMAGLPRVLIAAASALVLIGCSGKPDDTPLAPPAPKGGPVEELASGRDLYERYCAMCHGTSGRGDGPAASSLSIKPFDFTNKAQMANRTDADLMKSITDGKPPLMPPWGTTISVEERKEIIKHLRGFAK